MHVVKFSRCVHVHFHVFCELVCPCKIKNHKNTSFISELAFFCVMHHFEFTLCATDLNFKGFRLSHIVLLAYPVKQQADSIFITAT